MNTIGIVGLGLLGRGITTCLLSRGLKVVVLDRDTTVVIAARAHIDESLKEMVSRGALADNVATSWSSRYQEAASFSDFSSCQFVIESVAEDLATKRSVFKELEAVLPAETPIGSNTSALPITLLQAECQHPERIVGMHWAEPCQITRFLEMIRGDQTNEETAELAMQLGRQAGKDPTLVNKDVAGFIVNRLGYAMYREAFWLLEQGVADVETIDRSFRNAISVWADVAGPFRWMDLTGLPAYAAVMERLFPQLSNRTDVPPEMKALVESGAMGITNGRGFYQYTSEEAKRWEQVITDNVWRLNALPDPSEP